MIALRLTPRRISYALRPASHKLITYNLTLKQTFASQGYGDGDGDPIATNKQGQPANSRATQEAEHPGPATPHMKEKGNKGKSPEDASAQSGGSRSKDAVEKGESPTGGRLGGKD